MVNPFSTISSALGYSGGISEIGSLRNIKLIRNDGEIYTFDLYDLLIKYELETVLERFFLKRFFLVSVSFTFP